MMLAAVSIISYRTSVLLTIATLPIQLGVGITLILEVLQNSVYYCFQINVYPLPKILPSTLAYPPGVTWTLLNDSNIYTPTISFGAGLQKYFGFSSSIVSKTSGQIAIDSGKHDGFTKCSN